MCGSRIGEQGADQLRIGKTVSIADVVLLAVGGIDWATRADGLADNLTVARIHTYLVVVAGNQAVLVHNTCNGPKPSTPQWGHRGSPSWHKAKREIDEPRDHHTILGKVPTQDEAEDLIESAGGTILRAEKAHPPGGDSSHTYDHINYVNSLGHRQAVQIQETVREYP